MYPPRSQDGTTALHAAAALGHAAVVVTLLAHGADVHAVGTNGATALMVAAAMGHVHPAILAHSGNSDSWIFQYIFYENICVFVILVKKLELVLIPVTSLLLV